MKRSILDKDLTYLTIENDLILKLNDNNIFNIEELWSLKRSNLKDMNFSDSEINDIVIKLQLNALDLGNRKY